MCAEIKYVFRDRSRDHFLYLRVLKLQISNAESNSMINLVESVKIHRNSVFLFSRETLYITLKHNA